jgi:large subunit ribosomal protein L22
MEARAVAKYVRISPKKAQPVANLVRDKSVSEANDILEQTHKRATEPLAKAINSAQSNLEDQEPTAQPDDTDIVELRVDQGPTLDRFKPRAMGRATEVKKRSSHITVVVSNDTEET